MKKSIKYFLITLLLVSYMNVYATNNTIYVEGTYQQENARNMLSLINNWRQDTTNNWYYNSSNTKVYPGKLNPLTYDYGLEKIAMQRAVEASVNFAHQRPNGQSIYSIQANGYSSTGENIAAGYTAPQNVFTAWQETDEDYAGQGHRRNMLNSTYTSIGIACIRVPNTLFGTFCVQEFGRHSNINTTPTAINNEAQTIPVDISSSVFVTDEEVSLESNATTMLVGQQITLPLANTVVYSNANGMPAYIRAKSTLEWEITSGSDCITLNNNVVTATKIGTAVLTGKFGNSSVTYTINVNGITEVSSITLNKSNLTLVIGNEGTLTPTIAPSNATNKSVTWISSDDSIATVTNGKIKALKAGKVTITARSSNNLTATCQVTVVKPPMNVSYTTHVRNIGWQNYVKDGTMAGTSGKSLRLEGIKIKIENPDYTGDIEYRTHVQDIGWQDYVKNNAMSGTSHQSKRLEAIQIRLTGELANHYDVYYRVHAQDVGWMNWAKNNEMSGTASYGRRLEGIEIVLVEKGKTPPTRTNNKTEKAFLKKTVRYKTHVQDIGWQEEKFDGQMSGTAHQSKRLEGIEIKLHNINNGGIKYRTHIQDIGWQDWKENGLMSGTSHQSKRLEAIQIELTGEYATTHDVYYRVHAQNFGWMGWAKNGEQSGTAHYSYRLEGIEIVIVEKGETPPTRTDTKTQESFKDQRSQ